MDSRDFMLRSLRSLRIYTGILFNLQNALQKLVDAVWQLYLGHDK